MARKKKEECKSIPGWLISFGDLMSLLLTFFILLFSMGTISLEKFHMAIKGITESFGGRKIIYEEKLLNNSNVSLEFPNMYPKIKKKKRIQKELSDLQKKLAAAGIQAEVETHGSIVKFRMNSDKMFPIGSATPLPSIIPYINELCKNLKFAELPLTIEGHTDNIPIRRGIYKTNLELSAARAVAILRLFIKCGYDKNLLSARGYGEFRPLVPNTTPENRAKNRRVEFVIQTSG